MRPGGLEPPRGADTPHELPTLARLPGFATAAAVGWLTVAPPPRPVPAEFWITIPGSAGSSFPRTTYDHQTLASQTTCETQTQRARTRTPSPSRQVERRHERGPKEKTHQVAHAPPPRCGDRGASVGSTKDIASREPSPTVCRRVERKVGNSGMARYPVVRKVHTLG